MSSNDTTDGPGLEARFEVKRIGDEAGKHDECRYFVLDPQHDPTARVALTTYAATTPNNNLRRDLLAWLAEDLPERLREQPPGPGYPPRDPRDRPVG